MFTWVWAKPHCLITHELGVPRGGRLPPTPPPPRTQNTGLLKILGYNFSSGSGT